MPCIEARGTTRRKAQVPRRVLCQQDLNVWNLQGMTSSWSRLSTAPEHYADVPTSHEWAMNFNNKVLVSLMCLLAEMILQEKSHYKQKFAEACVKLALHAATSCKLVIRRESVGPEVATQFDFLLNFVEFLNRSYPVVQAAMGNATVCDQFFALHCQRGALTKALCINKIRWILIDFIPATGEAFVVASSQRMREIPELLQATSARLWLPWARIKEHLTALFNAQDSTELVNELGNFQLVMASKQGTGASNRLVLRLTNDADTDAAPSSLV
eukprot:s1117_g17.t1